MCARGEDTAIPIAPPDQEVLATLAASAPPMIGGEYIDAALFVAQWRVLDDAFAKAMKAEYGSVSELLHARHAAWHLVGRVHFNLAENRGDDEAPLTSPCSNFINMRSGGFRLLLLHSAGSGRFGQSAMRAADQADERMGFFSVR